LSCKPINAINVASRKCKICKIKQPNYNLIGLKPEFCTNCKPEYAVDVTHKLCIGQGGLCTQIADKKYDNHCARCFKNTFKNDPRSKTSRIKSKELKVRHFIDENFKGFLHDQQLQTNHCDCTVRRRPDHRKLIDGTMLCIETDENRHISYDKMDKETRYNDLYMAFSGKWIYIRFNPDMYYVTNKNGNKVKKNPRMSTRLDRLEEEIEKQIKRINNEENTELVERIYLYYDVVQRVL